MKNEPLDAAPRLGAWGVGDVWSWFLLESAHGYVPIYSGMNAGATKHRTYRLLASFDTNSPANYGGITVQTDTGVYQVRLGQAIDVTGGSIQVRAATAKTSLLYYRWVAD